MDDSRQLRVNDDFMRELETRLRDEKEIVAWAVAAQRRWRKGRFKELRAAGLSI